MSLAVKVALVFFILYGCSFINAETDPSDGQIDSTTPYLISKEIHICIALINLEVVFDILLC